MKQEYICKVDIHLKSTKSKTDIELGIIRSIIRGLDTEPYYISTPENTIVTITDVVRIENYDNSVKTRLAQLGEDLIQLSKMSDSTPNHDIELESALGALIHSLKINCDIIKKY